MHGNEVAYIEVKMAVQLSDILDKVPHCEVKEPVRSYIFAK